MTEVAQPQESPSVVRSWRERRLAAQATENAQFLAEGRVLAEVHRIADYAVRVADGEIGVRVYTPAGAGPHPAVLHLHGGGFALYSIDWLVSVDWCRDVCARVGAVVVDVDYRLAPEHPFPTAPEDVYRALLWLVENAGPLDVDLDRLVLAGESAGANLAAAAALMARDRSGPRPSALLLEIPAVDLADGHRHRSALEYADGFGLRTIETAEFNAAYLSKPDDALHPYASPIRADLRGLPPTHVMTAELDVLRDSGELFARRLRDAGVSTSLRRHRGHLHGSANRDRSWAPARIWRDEVVATLEHAFAPTAIADVRIEHLGDAFGIGVAEPRLSWTIESHRPGWTQTAYEVAARGEVVRADSGESVLVPWPFPPLRSRERVDVRVRARDDAGEWSPWSSVSTVEAGLLEESDWCARFVRPDQNEDSARDQPAPLLRREFVLDRAVARARLYISALGVYEPYVNGHVVGDDVLAPGWTSYDHRLRYQTYDVTELLVEGPNVLGAIVGDGWFRGRLGFRDQRNLYGDRLALLAQLEVTYADGSVLTIATDESWRASTGPILASSLYDGERYDARRELTGWAEPGYDDRTWPGVTFDERDVSTLVAPTGPPVRRTELLEPRAVLQSPSGRTIVDFGQNLVGRLRLRVRGEAGDVVTVRHAEVLEDGELCVWPLRDAAATDSYTLRGGEVEFWEPRFTFHGFRYAEIEGWPGELRGADIRAVVVHSDLERTGWFTCSDPLVDRLHENVLWSMRGNFLDVPTDCPQRDERLGWTGDIQVFAPTACFLYDCAGFLQTWLADLGAEQHARGGRVPNVVPDVLPPLGPGEPHIWHAPAAGWGDAAVVVPWVLYRRTGDVGVLAAQFQSMRSWVEYVAELVGPSRVWSEGFQFGDWLDPSAPPDRPQRASTDPPLVATAYFARSAELTADVAAVLGRTVDEVRFRGLAAEVRAAFARAFVQSDGSLTSDSQTAYALALEFALLREPRERERAGGRLAALVRDNGYRIGSGFLGTPIVCDALCAAGECETAYRLLLERECPSWLYPVTVGATTIWERWDSLRPDGSVNPGAMNSFNHYALGAIADWLHRTVAGLAPAAPGYRRIAIQPRPGGGLESARARHRTPYGPAEAGWALQDGTLVVDALVPPNTTAVVTLPGGGGTFEVGSGSHRWSLPFAAPAVGAGDPPG